MVLPIAGLAFRGKAPLRSPAAPLHGQRLKAFRLAAGISKEELARRAGLTLGTVISYETGEREPRWPSLTRLIQVLGVGLVALGFEGFTLPRTPKVPVAGKRHRPRESR